MRDIISAVCHSERSDPANVVEESDKIKSVILILCAIVIPIAIFLDFIEMTR